MNDREGTMTIDERARHELFLAVEHHLGPSQAETLMAMLPPVGWADVATKHDLVALEERMDLRFAALEHRLLGELDRRLNQQTRTLFLGVVGMQASLVALVATLLR
jgi:hypothetical protein